MNTNCLIAVFCCIGCANLLEEPFKRYLESLQAKEMNLPVLLKKNKKTSQAKDRFGNHFMN